MTTAAVTLPRHLAVLDDRSQSAVGETIREEFRILRAEELGTVTLSGRMQAIEALREVVEEAWESGSLEPNSLPVDRRAVRNALVFLNLLPSTFPAPDVAVESDGEIELEWYRGPKSVFSVSVGPGPALHFAGVFGRSEVHGVDYLVAEIPAQILEYAHRALVPE